MAVSQTKIGELNKRIDIESMSQTADGAGSFTTTWTPVARYVPAAIWPVSAKEIIQAGSAGMEITHRIRIRYRPGIRGSHRISYAGRYFNVTSVIDPDTAHRWLDLLCKEAAC